MNARLLVPTLILALLWQSPALAQNPACLNLKALSESALNDFNDMSGAVLNEKPDHTVHATTKSTQSIQGKCKIFRPRAPEGLGADLHCILDGLIPEGTKYVQDDARRAGLLKVAEANANAVTACLGVQPTKELKASSTNDSPRDSTVWTWLGLPRPSWTMRFELRMARSGQPVAPKLNEPDVVTTLYSPLRRVRTPPKGEYASRPGLDTKWRGNGWYQLMVMDKHELVDGPFPDEATCMKTKPADEIIAAVSFFCMKYHKQSDW